MSFLCPICKRTFSQRSAYSQHVQKCIKKAEIDDDDDDDVEMDTESNRNSDDENNDIGVIMPKKKFSNTISLG